MPYFKNPKSDEIIVADYPPKEILSVQYYADDENIDESRVDDAFNMGFTVTVETLDFTEWEGVTKKAYDTYRKNILDSFKSPRVTKITESE